MFDSSSLIGKQIAGRWQVNALIAEGGMSFVYKATDIRDDQHVAIKILKEDVSSSRVEDLIRFRREVTTVSKLSHPSLVKVYEVGEYQRLNYIIMELVDGRPMDAYIREAGRISQEKAIALASKIAEVLAYVHRLGVIHRDLKPGNIIVQNTDEDCSLKLLDFGLARVMEFAQIKDAHEIVGTFSYMSPEQTGIIRSQVSERSDLYSLGIVFYQLLTGDLPFCGEDISTILHQQIAKEPTPVCVINKDISPIIEQIISKLLKKDPEERYQTAKGLLEDLKKCAKGETSFVLGMDDRLEKLTYRTRLIGREKEFEELKRLYEKASAGEGSICLVAGEAGRGKSRLVDELRSYTYENGGEFIAGKCFAQENKIPYQPFVESINEYISKIEKLPREKKEDRIERMKASVGELAETVCRLNPLMREVFSDIPPLIQLDPAKEERRLLMVCSRFFRMLGEPGRPVVIVLDDLQWSDEGSLSLIREILEDISASPLLILGTFRDNEVDEQHTLTDIFNEGHRRHLPIDKIFLNNLDITRVNKVISDLLLKDEEETLELSRIVHNKSKGNPFFTIEIIRQLVDDNILSNVEGHWDIDWEKLKKVNISGSILEVLLKRINLIRDDQMYVLSAAAVIGRKFKIAMLYLITGKPVETLINLVDEAVDLQLLEKGSERDQILFVHDRIKDAFYQKIGPDKKRELHTKVALVLEDMNKRNQEDILFDLAHHYFEAGNKDKALEYSFPAAEKAREGSANEEAIKYYTVALDIFEERRQKGAAGWLRAKEGLIMVYLTTGRTDEVVKLCSEVLPYKKNSFEKTRLYRQIGEAYNKQGAWEKCEQALAEEFSLLGSKLPLNRFGVLVSLVKELIIHLLHTSFPTLFSIRKYKKSNVRSRELALGMLPLGWMYILTDLMKFLRAVLRFMNFCEAKIGKSKELGISIGGYASLCAGISLFKRGIVYQLEAIELRREINDEWGVAQSLQWLGYSYSWSGNHRQSLETFAESEKMFESMGDVWEICQVYNGQGHGYRYLGEYEKSMEVYSKYLDVSKKTHDDVGITSSLGALAFCCIEKGDLNKAEEFVLKSMEHSEKTGIWFMHCYGTVHAGYLEIERGNFDKAIEYLEKARRLFETNVFLRDYTVYLYIYLALAHIEKFKMCYRSGDAGIKEKQLVSEKQYLKKLRLLSEKAVKATKRWPNHYGSALRVYGQYCALAGRNLHACKLFSKSIAVTQKYDRTIETAKAYYEYGAFLKSINRIDDAKKYLWQAHNIFKEIGSARFIKRTEEILNIGPGTGEGETSARLQERLELSTVIATSHLLSSILDIGELLEKIMDVTIKASGAERGLLFLYPSNENLEKKLELRVARGIDRGQLVSEKFTVSNTVIKKVEESQEAVVIIDALEDEAFKTQMSVVQQGLRSVLCLPLKVKDKMLGVVYLDNHLVKGLFTSEKRELLKTILVQAAISVENARATQSLKEMQSELQVYAKELEEKVAERTAELSEKNTQLSDQNKILFSVNNRLETEIGKREEAQRELNAAYEELKKAQSQLVQSEKMAGIGLLAAGVAHEINNPSACVISNLESLKAYSAQLMEIITSYIEAFNKISSADSADIDAVSRKLEKIKTEKELEYIKGDLPGLIEDSLVGAKRVKNIVANLKDFFHPDHAILKPVNLNEEIEKALTLVAGELRAKCEIVKEFQEVPQTVINPGQVSVVLINILLNAAWSMDGGGKVFIRTYSNGSSIFMQFEDTGKGIASEIIDKIFDPFFTTKKVGEGTGLGLSMAYGIVKNFGGKIEVKSELGKGSIFTVEMPVNTETPPNPFADRL